MLTTSWQPETPLENLRLRAGMLQNVRAFFAARQVLEVETPILSAAANTDPQIESFTSQFRQQTLYLHTSPEFYMKRLLAAGSGDIYQICKVFRDDELGRFHNPEFTMLEWYRLGFDHHQLMDEMQQLLEQLINSTGLNLSGLNSSGLNFSRYSYQQLFIDVLGIDPLTADAEELHQCAVAQQIEIPQGMAADDKDMWLDWLMADRVTQQLPAGEFSFIYDYPASQAALARLSETDARIAHRFELYYGDLELANGFYELTDAVQQLQRFEQENRLREKHGQLIMPVDTMLIDALSSGLPSCAGVALGCDRLLMILAQAKHIREVIGFTHKQEK